MVWIGHQNLLIKPQRGGFFSELSAKSGQLRCRFEPLRTLSLLGEPQTQGMGEILAPVELSVEPLQSRCRLAVAWIQRAKLPPGGGGRVLVVELLLAQHRQLAPGR